jgi:RNA polymerase sigma factor (sigma-70 family)
MDATTIRDLALLSIEEIWPDMKRWARYLARRYHVSQREAYSAAGLACVEAAHSWDSTRSNFRTWATTRVKWAVQSVGAREQWHQVREQTAGLLWDLPAPEQEELDDSIPVVVAQLLRTVEERQRNIVLWRMDGETFAAIAIRLHLTRERIRQIEMQAFDRMRNQVDNQSIQPPW